MTETLIAHRLAALVPEMAPDEYDALRADIAAHGLIEPIVTYEGQILDGRNRHRGCLDTGTEPRFRPYEGDDPLGYVVSANLQRRHLSASQRAVLALAFESEFAVQAKEHQGTRTDLTSRQTCLKVGAIHAAEKAASVVGVSGRLVRDAKRLQREAPERMAGVLAGGRSIRDALADGRLDRKHAAVAAIAALPALPLDSLGPFPVLYADPPWRYKHANPSGQSRTTIRPWSCRTSRRSTCLRATTLSLFSVGTQPDARGGVRGHGGVALSIPDVHGLGKAFVRHGLLRQAATPSCSSSATEVTCVVRIQRIDRRQSSWRHAPGTQSSRLSSTR